MEFQIRSVGPSNGGGMEFRTAKLPPLLVKHLQGPEAAEAVGPAITLSSIDGPPGVDPLWILWSPTASTSWPAEFLSDVADLIEKWAPQSVENQPWVTPDVEP
tara:strand:- start:5453 stop:5761 length:309 start_codon:yes stop_codon:yes gene_type:complete